MLSDMQVRLGPKHLRLFCWHGHREIFEILRSAQDDILFLPDVADTFSKPARGDYFLLRVELHTFFALNVQIAVERFVPSREREHGHGRGHTDVDANHPGFDSMFEFARGFS